MTPMLRCFVAMAFDRDDTERDWRQLLRPALKSLDISATRVIDVEHNDDIDDRIRALLQSADFVVADLTYARPSVYYEAGYAEREVPVVYTCRSDHFKARTDDPNGNLRVHF